MLQSEFSESNLSVFNSHGEFAVGYEVPSEDYGYESDSDLEEDEDDDPTGEKSADGQSEAGKVDTANGGTETVGANGSNEVYMVALRSIRRTDIMVSRGMTRECIPGLQLQTLGQDYPAQVLRHSEVWVGQSS